MIPLTRLDGRSIVVNADMIQWIEQTPDTVISLVHGDKVLVREAMEEIVSRVVSFKRRVNEQSPTQERPS